MSPFSVTVQHVPDRDLGPLLTRLAEAGFANPLIDHLDADRASDKAVAPPRTGPRDLPEDWRVLREREGESYRWPTGREGAYREAPREQFADPATSTARLRRVKAGEVITQRRP